jgi:chemotaxis methyl-accepting protein methylase
MQLNYLATLDTAKTGHRLAQLLEPGALQDADLERRIERLGLDFRCFAASYPLPLWAPGLALTQEMRGLSEALFPLDRVRRTFCRLLRLGCRFSPLLGASYLYSSASWFDFLHRFQPGLAQADPAATLRLLAADGEARRAFLFALLLPHHFGGTFDRYPRQSQWLAEWLRQERPRLAAGIRVLDSACGSGEGTYGLAELVLEAGYRPEESEVHGSTLEHVELFAAAHGFFPHDPGRMREFRERVAPLLGSGSPLRIRFGLEDVGGSAAQGGYQVILCNGLLGGPMLHEAGELRGAVAALAARLAPGGVLLAADRFHAGWRLKVPSEGLVALMRASGLQPLQVPEGIAGQKG